MVFSDFPFGSHVKKFGSNFNPGFSFLSNSNLKCLFCPTQCSDCSLMHVLKSIGHKNLQLLLGMRSSSGAFSMPRCSVMSMGTPLFYFKIEVLM